MRKNIDEDCSQPAQRAFCSDGEVVEAFGFRLSRVSGSHHIFVHSAVPELVNLQDVDGKAKPYQIRQFLKLVEKYNLKMEGEA
jgi:predicted RNA binding protein YcfA (HicA-like mRNA interferase family)